MKRAALGVYYSLIKLKNIIKLILFNKEKNSSYLFILSPPLTGSTMIVDILSSSKNLSVNNYHGTKEGQTLPEVRKMMFESANRWDENKDFDWNYIKRIWLKYWDRTKPILLEKSPANILRVKSIEKTFKPCKFIISYRNPYAQCESIIRRGNQTAEYAANFAVLCLKHQKKNIENYKDKSIVICYEDITENPEKFKGELIKFMPDLGDISVNRRINAHNQSGTPIRIKNLNENKIKSLTQSQLETINHIFTKNEHLINYFGYQIINT